MRIRVLAALAAALWMGMMTTSRTSAAVDLELRTNAQVVSRFAPVEVTLYAVWDGVGPTDFTIVNAALTWDPSILALDGPAKPAGAHSWGTLGIYGFELDNQRDRLNADCGADSYCSTFTEAPFNDGTAFFQALSFGAETATAQGEAIATFTFVALGDTAATEIVIEPLLGTRSYTEVLAPGPVDVSGEWYGASIEVQTDAVLRASDVILPAGRWSDIYVSAEVIGQSVYAVEVLLEIVAESNTAGTVEFTPEDDILQLGDPWPGAGDFVAFESDQTFSPTLNGSSEDNGTFVAGPLTFVGDLVALPVFASNDAAGTWELRLATSVGNSAWFPETVKTGTDHGTLTIVELGDGDGSGLIDVRDYFELQSCFTGDVGPADPSAYSMDPRFRCNVYDFDDDGDVDWSDYAEYRDVLSGSAP